MSSPTSAPSLFQRIGGRDALITLLTHFYADVRQHREIAPIFASKIEDWPSHIQKIADFWSGVIGGPALYKGGMPMKHFPLGLQERHFEAWLGLWKRNCATRLPSPESEELAAAADMIGQRLRQIIKHRSTGVHISPKRPQ